MESTSYRRVLNSLLSSPFFIHFIEHLHTLDSVIYESENAFTNIEKKIGKHRFDETIQMFNSSTDYEHDENAPKLTDEQIEALGMIDSAIDKQYDSSFAIKIARYELHEAFESLIESLYPRKK